MIFFFIFLVRTFLTFFGLFANECCMIVIPMTSVFHFRACFFFNSLSILHGKGSSRTLFQTKCVMQSKCGFLFHKSFFFSCFFFCSLSGSRIPLYGSLQSHSIFNTNTIFHFQMHAKKNTIFFSSFYFHLLN